MGILTVLSKLKRNRMLSRIRPMINTLYYDPDTVILHMANFDTISVDGCRFYASNQLDSLQKVGGNKWFEGIRPGDIAVDIGANIGSITIPLAKVARQVHAVEPVYYKELEENIKLNELTNVKVIPVAIGEGKHRVIEFAGKSRDSQLITFARLRSIVGDKIDFLKIDCEGAEWDIQPETLRGIRQIRVEFHIRRTHTRSDKIKMGNWLLWLKHNGYKLDVNTLPVRVNPYYTQNVLLRAWL